MQPLTYANNAQVDWSMCVFPFSLVLARHPLREAIFDILSTIPSNLGGNVSPPILRSHLWAKLAFVSENVYSRFTAAQKWKKYGYDRRIRKIPVFETNKLVFLDKSLLAESTNKLETTDKSTYIKAMSRAKWLYRFISVQQDTLIDDLNGVPNTIQIFWTAPELSNNTNAIESV